MIPFLLFKTSEHAESFHQYLSNCHNNINFTIEQENGRCLSFLDVLVRREESQICTSVFRKDNYTGKGTNFFSFIYPKYKLSSIQTLIHRAFQLCSNNYLFRLEVEFLRKFFTSNNYPVFLFNNLLQKYMDKKFNFNPTYASVGKLSLHLGMPFIGDKADYMAKELRHLIADFFPYVDPKLFYRSNNRLESWFSLKDKPKNMMRSNIIYSYTCDCCSQSYVGSTAVQLFVRSAQHRGVSFRTGLPLSNPVKSSIRDHCFNLDHPFNSKNFKIIDSALAPFDLRILESLHILKIKPPINECNSAVPLYISK